MKKLKQEVFEQRVKNKYGDAYEIPPYTNQHAKVLVRHKKCGYEWMIDPWALMRGNIKECPKCSNKWKRTTLDFKEEVSRLFDGEYEVVGEYKSTNTPIMMLHKTCGTEFLRIPREFKQGVRCPVCRRPNYYETTETFKERVKNKYGDKYSIVGEYQKARIKIRVKCNDCGTFFETTPDNLMRGHGCPVCVVSRGEDIIAKWLTKNGISFVREYKDSRCKYKRVLRFDFAVLNEDNSLKLLIEFDGKHHFSPTRFYSNQKNKSCEKEFLDCKIRDQIKNSFCKENGIKLIRISYKQFDELEKILESVITHDNPVPIRKSGRCNDHRSSE